MIRRAVLGPPCSLQRILLRLCSLARKDSMFYVVCEGITCKGFHEIFKSILRKIPAIVIRFQMKFSKISMKSRNFQHQDNLTKGTKTPFNNQAIWLGPLFLYDRSLFHSQRIEKPAILKNFCNILEPCLIQLREGPISCRGRFFPNQHFRFLVSWTILSSNIMTKSGVWGSRNLF